MKKLIFIITLFLSFNAFTQQSYKIFTDSVTGKVYYNKHLPVYFWISTAPDNSGQDVLLRPKVKKFANPYYWDTEGVNTFRVKNPKNNRGYKEAVFEIWSDGRAPLIYITFQNVLYTSGKPLLGRASKIRIKATDYISGVDKVFYAIDNNDFKPYDKPFGYLEPGTHKLKVFATDRVGNISDTTEKTFTVDLTPPEVSAHIVNSVSDTILSNHSYITLKANDKNGIKAIYYKFDDSGDYLRYVSPLTVKYLKGDRHILYYYAVDKLGNQSQVFSLVFRLDNTAPQISYQILGDQYKKGKITYVSPNTKIKVLAQDASPVDKIYYIINNRSYSTKTNLIDLSKTKGYTQLCFSAKDVAGNKSPSKCIHLYVDYRPPKTIIKIGQPKFFDRDTTFITPETPVTFYATDDNSGVAQIFYAINNRDFKPYNGKINIRREGLNILYYHAKDNVGNIEETNKRYIYVDDTPPEISVTFSIEPIDIEIQGTDTLNVYPGNIKIYLSARDDKTGERRIKYSLNGAKLAYYSAPLYLSTKRKKTYTLYIESLDALGNKSTKTVKFIMRP